MCLVFKVIYIVYIIMVRKIKELTPEELKEYITNRNLRAKINRDKRRDEINLLRRDWYAKFRSSKLLTKNEE